MIKRFFLSFITSKSKDALLYSEIGGNILSSSTNEVGDVYQV